jgi:hypothetical protein
MLTANAMTDAVEDQGNEQATRSFKTRWRRRWFFKHSKRKLNEIEDALIEQNKARRSSNYEPDPPKTHDLVPRASSFWDSFFGPLFFTNAKKRHKTGVRKRTHLSGNSFISVASRKNRMASESGVAMVELSG